MKMLRPYTEIKPVPKSTQSTIALHLMINQLSVSSMPVAIRRRNVIVNDVPSDLVIKSDEQKLAAVLGNLLNTVIGHANDSYIRITAKLYGGVTLLHIKENSRLNSPAFANSLVEIQELAEKIGGSVSVTSYRNDITTIALSITNMPFAA